jgi:hypothetical protein
MRRMKRLASVLFATSLFAACSNAELEDRVKKLEEQNKKYSEALDYLQKVYDHNKQSAEQQAKQQKEQEDNEPAPDAVFAVNVADDVKGAQVEGPNSACVTVIEAWDFA